MAEGGSKRIEGCTLGFGKSFRKLAKIPRCW
jgi:hypothetical protein